MLFFIENRNISFSDISKNISGIVYVKINDIYFPTQEWDDIITMVLDGWTLALSDLPNPKAVGGGFVIPH